MFVSAWSMLVVALCTPDECGSIADWLSYSFLGAGIDGRRAVCIADAGMHQVWMGADGRCVESASVTCFRCRRHPQHPVCGRYLCGGPTAGVCEETGCACNPGYALNVDLVCEFETLR